MFQYLSLIVCLIGLVVYLITNPQRPKVSEVGKIMFGVGLLIFLYYVPTWHVHTLALR